MTPPIVSIILVLQVIKKVTGHAEINATAVAVYLLVGSRPGGITTLDIQKELNLTPAATSRVLSLLSGYHRGSKERGLGVIKLIENIENRRLKRVVLTKKGRKLFQEIEQVLERSGFPIG